MCVHSDGECTLTFEIACEMRKDTNAVTFRAGTYRYLQPCWSPWRVAPEQPRAASATPVRPPPPQMTSERRVSRSVGMVLSDYCAHAKRMPDLRLPSRRLPSFSRALFQGQILTDAVHPYPVRSQDWERGDGERLRRVYASATALAERVDGGASRHRGQHGGARHQVLRRGVWELTNRSVLSAVPPPPLRVSRYAGHRWASSTVQGLGPFSARGSCCTSTPHAPTPTPTGLTQTNDAAKNDATGVIPEPVLAGLRSMGAYGLQVPEALGGVGLSNSA